MITAVDVGWDVTVVAVVAALACLAGALRMRTISRRARATAAALEVSEQGYRQLAANLPEVTVMLFDPDLRFTHVEGGAIARHGWDAAELVGRRLEEVIPPERYAEIEARYRAALAGEAATFEWRGVRDDAVYSAKTVPVRDDTGAVTGGMVLVTDVTERTRAELRLRAGEAMHRSVVDSVGDVVFQTDLEGRCSSTAPGRPTAAARPRSPWAGTCTRSSTPRTAAPTGAPSPRCSRERSTASPTCTASLRAGARWGTRRSAPTSCATPPGAPRASRA